MPLNLKNATVDDSLILYDELTRDQTRTIQRRIKAGELRRIVPSSHQLSARRVASPGRQGERNRILAALFSGAVIGYRTAFKGGMPVDGIMHLSYSYDRVDNLPGLTVVLGKGAGKATGDMPLSGPELYFPSNARLLIENLTISRAKVRKTVSRKSKSSCFTICELRRNRYVELREQARDLAPTLGFERVRHS